MKSIFKRSGFGKHTRRIFCLISFGALLAACDGQFRLGQPSEGLETDAGPTVDVQQPVKVALLVPTGGSEALDNIGQSMVNAAKMAISDYNRQEIDLEVYPTAGNPVQAAKVAAQAEAEGAKLILGPLRFEEVAAISASSSLPMLSFSNNSKIAGKNIYILGTTFDVIADRVLEYQKSQGGSKLGVVFSNDLPGQLGAESTVNVANAKNIKVVATEAYNLTQEDIQASGPRIAKRLSDSGADMVMLTDNPAGGGLSFIALALRDNGLSGPGTSYLGLSRWEANAKGLSEAGLDGGIFAETDPVRRSNFETRYKASYGSTPHILGGLGFDAAIAAIQLVRNARAKNDNTPFSTRDIDGIKFVGANGAIIMDGHMVKRGLAVMKLQGGTAFIVSPAPGQF